MLLGKKLALQGVCCQAEWGVSLGVERGTHRNKLPLLSLAWSLQILDFWQQVTFQPLSVLGIPSLILDL
jgi:hypothetical protein